MHDNGRRLTVEEQAARIARRADDIGMEAPTLQVLIMIYNQMNAIQDDIADLRHALDSVGGESDSRDWFTTSDVAELLGVSRQHVTERLCNQQRIECERHPPVKRLEDETDKEFAKRKKKSKWRIPRHEYERLRQGGKPLPSSPGRTNGG